MKRRPAVFLAGGIIMLLLISLPPVGRAAPGAGSLAAGVVPLGQGASVVWRHPLTPERARGWPPLEPWPAGLAGQANAPAGPTSSVGRGSGITGLEPGFPVQALTTPGTYHGGAANHTLVGNIDQDPTLEIVVTALASGPLYAWKADGSPVPGWPAPGGSGVAYPAMGNLSAANPGFEVFAGYMGLPSQLFAFAGTGTPLPGWPRDAFNATIPAALADVDGDGLDEIFTGEGDGQLYAYHADGAPLPGWPVRGSGGGPARTTPAIVDLDGDGDLEILTASAGSIGEVYLYAYHHDGTPVSGFPVFFVRGRGDMFPAVGDVDGDGRLEIVVVAQEDNDPWRCYVAVLNTDGGLKRRLWIEGGQPASSAVALADLDRDCVPEIIAQAPHGLNAWHGDGSVLPGWPALWGGTWENSSAPVVGDVDGDTWPDVLITTLLADSDLGEVRVYDRSGTLLPGFPFQLLLGGGAVPAIADIDLDGHNEILVTSSYWPGYPGYYDKVWAYDLGGPPHGRIEWGQFGGGPQHQGYYPPGVIPAADLTARSDSPTLLGHTTTLTATTRLGCGVAYTWALGDGTLGSGAVLTHTYAALGTYTAIVTASNSLSLLTATTVVTVAEEPINGLHAVSDSPTVLGQATALTATVVSGSRVTYTWDLGDGATGSGALVTHTYPALGPYTAVVTASNSVSLLTATTTVMIVDEPITSLSAASDSPTALGTPTTLSATVVAGGHVVYDWDLGDGAGGSGALLTHTYAAVGAYTAVVTASNVGSTGTATTTVRVEQAVSGLRAVNDSPTALGRPTALAAAVAAGTDVHYRWDLGDGTVLFLPFLAHVYPALGTYTAVVTASNSVSLLTATTAVLIVPDVPIRGLAAANDSPTVLGRPTTLSATVAAGTNVTYTWALGDGTMGAGAVLTHTYAAAGVYTAVVTASNSVGLLRATTPVTVVRPLFSIYLPLAWRGRP